MPFQPRVSNFVAGNRRRAGRESAEGRGGRVGDGGCRDAAVSDGDSVRLRRASDGHRAQSHAPVRPANQPVQRKDLRVPLVLVRRRRCRRQLLHSALVVDRRLPNKTNHIHPTLPQGCLSSYLLLMVLFRTLELWHLILVPVSL